MPTDNLLFCPPDKFLDKSLAFSSKSKSLTIYSTNPAT